MDYSEILPDLCNMTQEFELTHSRLQSVSIQEALKKEKNPSFKFYILIVHLQDLRYKF